MEPAQKKQKVKVCYIVTIADTIKAFFVKQLKFLRDNGFDVYVICTFDNKLKDILGNDIKYIPIRIERGIAPFNIIKTICELIKVIKQNKFDIIQYSTPNAAFCAAIAAKIAGTTIRNYHIMGFRYQGFAGLKKRVFKCIEKFMCMLSTHIECITKSNLELGVKEKIFPRCKAAIIWNGSTGGVDLKRFDAGYRSVWRDEVRKKLCIENNKFIFGFVGRITKDKGVNEIIEAFKELNKDCILLIIGKEEGVNTLDHKLWYYAKNCDSIIIHEPVEDIEKYYAAIDVLLLPSYREGFGMVIAEAAAMGTPAIVSDIPGPIDVIKNGKTALTVKVKDYRDLEEKMNYFYCNKDNLSEWCNECIEYIKHTFDDEVLNEQILKHKLSLLSQITKFTV